MALKNILTLGIHTKIWLYRVNREMDGHEGFHIDLRWLAVMVTLPIITPAIVKFQTARRMDIMLAHQLGLPRIRPRTLGWISLVPVLGSGFYAGWVQWLLNRHWFWHRREERIRIAKERIKEIAEAPESEETLKRRFALEDEVRQIEEEIRIELDAAKVRLGEERFREREQIAAEYAQRGRLSRKELAELRKKRKARGKQAKGEKAPKEERPGLLVRIGLKRPPVEADGAFVARTKPPKRMPDEVRAAAAAEDREPTKKELLEIKMAERRLAAREKEREKWEAAREKEAKAQAEREAKERAKKEKAEAQARLKEEKTRLKKEQKEAAAATKAAKKGDKPGKAKKEKNAKKAEAPAVAPDKGIPVKQKPSQTAPRPSGELVVETGPGPLRSLSIQCPRCRTTIRNIKKRGDAPAKVTCPNCSLVGKV